VAMKKLIIYPASAGVVVYLKCKKSNAALVDGAAGGCKKPFFF